MFEAIWNALDFWQKCGVVMFAVAIPVGIIAQTVGNPEGLTLWWAEMKRKFKEN